MFWDTSYSNSANIDALLNKDDCSLKELLDDEDILQECKSQNQKLVKFLSRPEIVDELVTLITTEPPIELDEKQRFLYPNVACEILTSDVPVLKQRMAEDVNIMNKLYGFFEEQTGQLNPLLASFICKTFGTLILKKSEQDWFLYQTICLHVLEFIKSKDNFLDVMLQHFATPVVMDLMLNMLNDVEDAKMKSTFLEWINEKGLIEKMIDVICVPDETSKHTIIAQFLIELIKTGRCNRQSDTEDRKSLPNPLLQRMEESQTTTRLIDAILCDTRTESGILAGLQVLLCLLENSIIQEPVSQTALQQIIDAEKEHHDEVVTSLMSIIQPRVHQLFDLLLNPPKKTPKCDVNNATLTPPLGNIRLQLCNLFTVLVETENSLIIEEICKTSFFTELLNLFKQYCWNNFLHNYVKRCLTYGVQAFDIIPNSTQLVISALQKHIIVDCKLADKLIDCWNANAVSQQQHPGGRRLGYMGHLIDIIGAINSTVTASDEFRALIESSLTCSTLGSGEPESETAVDTWHKIMQANEEELKVQKRFLADCDPSKERQEYGRDGLLGFPSIPDESENDTEDFTFNYNPSMHSAVNGLIINDFSDFNDDDTEIRNKLFEEACNQNISTISFETDFDSWDQQQIFNTLSLKTSPFNHEDDLDDESENKDPFATTDPFEITETSTSSNFDAIIDNFADFDTHFASMPPPPEDNGTFISSTTQETKDFPSEIPSQAKEKDVEEPPCFVTTTQVIEISSAPPVVQDIVKREFHLGPSSDSPAHTKSSYEEFDDEEFYSLRDDSNEMSSLTDDNAAKFIENTEVPEDDDDDFASADESSSKGTSEEETNSNGGDQFVDCVIQPAEDCKSDDESDYKKVNGVEKITDTESNEIICESTLSPPENTAEQILVTEKFAQSNDEEEIKVEATPVVVPFENGSA